MSTEAKAPYSKLIELMLRLQQDCELLTEFNLDPDKVMIEAGITSEEDRNTLKTRDMLNIHSEHN